MCDKTWRFPLSLPKILFAQVKWWKCLTMMKSLSERNIDLRSRAIGHFTAPPPTHTRSIRSPLHICSLRVLYWHVQTDSNMTVAHRQRHTHTYKHKHTQKYMQCCLYRLFRTFVDFSTVHQMLASVRHAHIPIYGLVWKIVRIPYIQR